jgi:hypothetical protein
MLHSSLQILAAHNHLLLSIVVGTGSQFIGFRRKYPHGGITICDVNGYGFKDEQDR